MADFLEYRECAGCGEWFPVRSPRAHRAKWCSERCRKAQYDEPQPCVDCGALTSSSRRNGLRAMPRCVKCAAVHVAAPQRTLIERLWAEGKTMREINDTVGHRINFSTLRARGYNLPHRHRVGDLTLRLANLARAREAARKVPA